MRTCPSCGRENPLDADFCSCGEYLRWEPTNYVKAVTPAEAEAASQATPAPGSAPPAGSAAPAPAAGTPPAAAPGPPAASNGGGGPGAPAAPIADPNATIAPEAVPGPQRAWGAPAGAGGLPQGAAPAPGTPGSGDAPPGAASLTLRPPGDDSASPGAIAVEVEPGQQVTLVGTIRNQSEVVDNFDLWIRGLPEGWWTIAPATAYLVPYGTGGTYEQEFQVLIHPPRSPQAQARSWSFEVVADSRAYGGEVVAAPASVTIGPYYELATELRPERGSGRLKARFRLIVRNKANARTEVALKAEDADGECQFRFAEPKIALEPGNALECPFTALPPGQIWLGRAVERRFQVTAQPLGVEVPNPPRMAVFRQKPWLPWWLAIVAPIAIVLAIVAIKLMPHQAPIPKLKGLASVFKAEQVLNKDGFVLNPKTTAVVDPNKPPGSVADQSPPPGTKAKKGTVVTLAVYGGTGQVTVPSVVGDTPGLADQALRTTQLALGAVSPQPLNPQGKISSQLPLAGTKVAAGTAVAVFLATTPANAAAAKAAKAAAAAGAAGAAAGAAGAAGAGGGGKATAAALSAAAAQAGTGSIVIPKLAGDPAAAAGKLSQLGLQPKPLQEVATVPLGQVAGTVPGPGAKVAKGAVVDVLISTGSPQLAYDNQQTISVIDPLTGKPSGGVPPGTGPQVEPSWSPDGTHVIYSQNGQLVIDRPDVKGAVPFQLTGAQPGVLYQNPAFAPTLKALIIAFIKRTSGGSQLCFATIGKYALHPDCTSAPGWALGGEVDWSPDGSTILVLGTRNKGTNFGILAFTSNVPFSTQASDWGQGSLQTDATTPGQGVFDAAFSPDGKELALVANLGGNDFHLYVAPANTWNPLPAQQLPVRACQVAWRPDGKELAVMQPDGLCGPLATGTIVAIDPTKPDQATILATHAAHPAWQSIPVASGG